MQAVQAHQAAAVLAHQVRGGEADLQRTRGKRDTFGQNVAKPLTLSKASMIFGMFMTSGKSRESAEDSSCTAEASDAAEEEEPGAVMGRREPRDMVHRGDHYHILLSSCAWSIQETCRIRVDPGDLGR